MDLSKYSQLEDSVRKIPDYAWLVVGLTIALVFQMLFWPITKEMGNRGYSIVDFELAWDKTTMDKILNAWQGILDDAIKMTLLDFGFIIGYTILLLSLLSIVNKSRKTGPAIRQYDKFQKLIIVAALADVVENLFSIYILSNPETYLGLSVFFMSLASAIKWVIVLATVLSIFEGLLRGLVEWINSSRN